MSITDGTGQELPGEVDRCSGTGDWAVVPAGGGLELWQTEREEESFGKLSVGRPQMVMCRKSAKRKVGSADERGSWKREERYHLSAGKGNKPDGCRSQKNLVLRDLITLIHPLCFCRFPTIPHPTGRRWPYRWLLSFVPTSVHWQILLALPSE